MYITIFIFTFANAPYQMIIDHMKKNYKIQENTRVGYDMTVRGTPKVYSKVMLR